MHAPAPSAVLGAQHAHRERIAKARRREAEENRIHSGTAAARATGIVYTTAEAAELEIDHPDSRAVPHADPE
jgi:hypothetical protein